MVKTINQWEKKRDEIDRVTVLRDSGYYTLLGRMEGSL